MTSHKRTGTPRPIECSYTHRGSVVKRTRATSAVRALQQAIKHLALQDYPATTCKIGEFDQARDYCHVQRARKQITVTLLRGSL